MKKSKKTKGCTATPVRVSIPLMPEPLLTGQSKPNLKETKFQIARSFPTSIQNAETFTQEKFTECRRFIRHNDFDKLHRVIHSVPSLQESPYVQDMLHRYRNRSYDKRGRPAGLYSFNPTVIAGLVNKTVETGQASSNDKAFYLVAELLDVSYDVIKRHFYEAKKADMFRSTVIEMGESREVTTEEMQKLASAQSIFRK